MLDRPHDVLGPQSSKVNFASIYRMNALPPADIRRILDTPILVVSVIPGPFQISYTVPVRHLSPGTTAITFGTETRSFGKGSYLAISHFVDVTSTPDARSVARLPLAEIAAALALTRTHLLDEKLFEGVLNEPGQRTFWPEGPITVSSPQPTDMDSLSQSLATISTHLEKLDPQLRHRFQLAARWYMRGHETPNPVDKILFWYIALEVYPAQGNTNLVRCVRDVIHSHLYSDLDPGLVKERIGIGRIAGLRNQIVHDGKSFVELPHDTEFETSLQKLEAIATTALRILGDFPPGHELDRWVRS